MISGKPVCSATSLTVMPWLTRSLAVPPVDSSSIPRSRTALVAPPVGHDHFEQRLLHFAHHEVVEMRRLVAVQCFKITLQRFLCLRTQGHALAIHLEIAAVESLRYIFA